ncbi:hypothetical protein GGR54DRAFT_330900 [Hypoxylon sp. NC1633]|nr:hypothetical protein GGR54DRAFT_330900 [Hypoxylon sp. NC1633]
MLTPPQDRKEAGTGQSTPAPGVTTEVLTIAVFDFPTAFEVVKNRLDGTLSEHWLEAVSEAVALCDHLIRADSPSRSTVSACWFSIKFLDLLWRMLFGRASGSSPWFNMLDGLKSRETNGSADFTINIHELCRQVYREPELAEFTVLDFMDGCFPMKILMPEVIKPEALE